MRGFVSRGARRGILSRRAEDEKKKGGKEESCYLDGRPINGWQHPAQHNKLTAARGAQRPRSFCTGFNKRPFRPIRRCLHRARNRRENIFRLDHGPIRTWLPNDKTVAARTRVILISRNILIRIALR